MPKLIIDIQNVSSNIAPPSKEEIVTCLQNALSFIDIDETEIELTIRFCDTDEIQHLNHTYRQINKPTNVLSFPATYNAKELEYLFLGDLVISLDIVQKESIEQRKKFEDHLTHMIIHGFLHLLGYDHIEDNDAQQMETLEIEILNKIGINDPYESNH